MHIVTIDDTSPYLADVKSLWRANASTLGFFPDGAFRDYACKRGIIVALDPHGQCAGYLLFRKSRGQATIVHLCTSRSYRNKGVARALVNHLSNSTRNLQGIGLWCRRDFEATRLWPRLGFVAIQDKRGKSREGAELTFWWLDHRHPNLFSLPWKEYQSRKLQGVVDMNIFYDLQAHDDLENQESKALLADWLQECLELCLNEETLNEINRISDPEARTQQRKLAKTYTILECDSQAFEEAIKLTQGFFVGKTAEQDEIDSACFEPILKTLSASDETLTSDAVSEVEHLLWPAKVTDVDVPTYIVPIQPRWAQHLFEERLASQTLFGAAPELALSPESVYYRAKRPPTVLAPGRILWYVSWDKRYEGSGQVRACSRIEEVVLDKPETLYRRFRRLGIYTLDDLLKVVHGDPDATMMAIRFSDTELFANPISWESLQDMLSKEGCRSQIQSPYKISGQLFKKLYLLGTSADSSR